MTFDTVRKDSFFQENYFWKILTWAQSSMLPVESEGDCILYLKSMYYKSISNPVICPEMCDSDFTASQE